MSLKSIETYINTMEKTCSHCKETKEITEFCKGRGTCKVCQREMCRNYKASHRKEIGKYNQKYKAEHKTDIKQYNHDYSIANREVIQKRQNKQHAERKKTDANYRITCLTRSKINDLMRRHAHDNVCGHDKYIEFIDCSMDYLKTWFMFNFDDKMTFDNYGKVWHIDHLISCSRFDVTDKEEYKKCHHWSNLRPMIGQDNLEKTDTLTELMIDEHIVQLGKFIRHTKNNPFHSVKFLEYPKDAYLKVRVTKW